MKDDEEDEVMSLAIWHVLANFNLLASKQVGWSLDRVCLLCFAKLWPGLDHMICQLLHLFTLHTVTETQRDTHMSTNSFELKLNDKDIELAVAT